MVTRDLLARHRRGRKTPFGLTARSVDVLRDGPDRIWRAGGRGQPSDPARRGGRQA
ncbi:hypothetical protein ACFVT2_08480 [Streptomyces sp. NPDC058000]|uniref:hypothetical protein n=1 Tax=Streptomyces sp. NPDC058000 TaxID=3346299 RepID=UPI0036EC0F6D